MPIAPIGGYPADVKQIFNSIPRFEYYEPKAGKNWGDVPPQGIYPFEVDEAMPYIYFRDTSPPDCNIRYKKYIILYYDYSKRGPVKAKDGKPIFVPYLLLVSERFGEAISNYINIPVWNPAIVKYVTIRVNRRYKKPLVKKKKKKRGKHHKKGKKGKHGKPQHQNMKGPHAKGKGKKKEEAPN